MYNPFDASFSALPLLRRGRSRSINRENPTGEKGRGGMAASPLGLSRKGSPCIGTVAAGETVTLAEMDGPGVIEHIWITVTDATPAGRYVLRDVVLRMYWDGEAKPSVESPLGDFFCNGFGRGCEVSRRNSDQPPLLEEPLLMPNPPRWTDVPDLVVTFAPLGIV